MIDEKALEKKAHEYVESKLGESGKIAFNHMLDRDPKAAAELFPDCFIRFFAFIDGYKQGQS